MRRRNVLKWMAAVPAAWTLPLWGDVRPQTPLWTTLAALLDHLLPGAPGVPSAARIGAAEYLYATMRHPRFDFEIRDFIFEGASWVEQASQSGYGRPFERLDASSREWILRLVLAENPRGTAWLSTLMNHLLEALLGDPIYGGNRGEAGWRWLGHTPGAPRPQKRYVFDV